MVRLTGWMWLAVIAAAGQGFATAQVLGNPYLTGKYYFRQVSLGTDTRGKIMDGRSILGTMVFDGAGRFTYTGQRVIGAGVAEALSGTGTYTVDAAGFVTMNSLLGSAQV